MIREAIILAGGLGTRLRSAVPDLPKCMAPVAGKPFLHYVIQHLQQEGIERFIFSLGYMSEPIIEYIQQEHPDIESVFSIEEEPLGTGGAIRLACSKVIGDNVLAMNGDTMFSISLQPLSEFHEQHGADCTLSLKPMKDFDRYGVVEISKDLSIVSFKEKQYYASGLINGGVYALNTPHFLALNLPAKFSFEKDYLETYFQQLNMFGLQQDAYFIDIGIPSDFERAQIEFQQFGS